MLSEEPSTPPKLRPLQAGSILSNALSQEQTPIFLFLSSSVSFMCVVRMFQNLFKPFFVSCEV